MKIEIEQINNQYRYSVLEHRAIQFHRHYDDTNFETKLKFVEEFLDSTHAKFKQYTRRDVLKDFAKTDEAIAEQYKREFPKGGYRKNAGRKVGSFATGVRSNRTEQFSMAITKEEKQYLTYCLEWFRLQKLNDPKQCDIIMNQFKLYGVESLLNYKSVGLTGKLRTINKE